jgi:hypothetical protein
LTGSFSPAQPKDLPVSVTLNTDESDAVLAILEKKQSGEAITQADWDHLFSSEGYVRLKKREASFKREFTDDEFRSFVLSDSLAQRYQILKTTLAQWKRIDVTIPAKRALAYLPQGAHIKATILPVIKPRTNSFVFESTTNPAIFLYLDPDVSAAKFDNTLAHELHHIGYANSCGAVAARISEDTAIARGTRTVLEWIGAFGEGFAMLAAAGGPDIHPHAVSKPDVRARWDRDMMNFNQDLKKVERFFLDVLDNKLNEEQIRDTAFSFFGIQGPWYTVGWKMAVTIEKQFGRAKLIDCLCDPRALLPAYNKAADEHNRVTGDSLAVWSSFLLARIGK